ncbi:MAG: hypothetical protein C4318_02030 [Acidimicrobiia bacterium]
MKRLFFRQVDAALFRGASEKIPFLIISAGFWIALRLVRNRKRQVIYRRKLKEGETIKIAANSGSILGS